MKTLIIVNPASANGKTGRPAPACFAHFCAAHLVFDVAMTQRAGHATDLAAQEAGRGYERVACVGGDGTVNEVVNGLMQCAAPPVFAVIPCGTGSDFARALGIKDTLHVAAHLLQHGVPRPMDVGAVECPRDGQLCRRYFINVFKVLRRYENKQLRVTLKMSDVGDSNRRRLTSGL